KAVVAPGDVERKIVCAAAGVSDLLGRLRYRRLVDVQQHDACALAGKSPRDRPSDAGSGPGNGGYVVFKKGHGLLPNLFLGLYCKLIQIERMENANFLPETNRRIERAGKGPHPMPAATPRTFLAVAHDALMKQASPLFASSPPHGLRDNAAPCCHARRRTVSTGFRFRKSIYWR